MSGIEAQIQRAEKLFADGKAEQAQTILQSILKAHPNHATALNDLGVIAFHERKFEKAAQYLSRAVQVEPKAEESNANLLATFQAQERYLDALLFGVAARLRLRESEPVGAVFESILGLLVEKVIEVVEISDFVATPRFEMNALHQKQIENALRRISRNEKYPQHDPRLHLAMVLLLFFDKKYAEARNAAAELASRHPTGWHQLLLVRMHLLLGEVYEAFAALRTVDESNAPIALLSQLKQEAVLKRARPEVARRYHHIVLEFKDLPKDLHAVMFIIQSIRALLPSGRLALCSPDPRAAVLAQSPLVSEVRETAADVQADILLHYRREDDSAKQTGLEQEGRYVTYVMVRRKAEPEAQVVPVLLSAFGEAPRESVQKYQQWRQSRRYRPIRLIIED